MTGADAETNLEGFAFGDVWTLTDSYPVLTWQVQDVDVSLSNAVVAEGGSVEATVTLTLDDGSTVTASEVAEYDAGSIASADAGVVEATHQGTTRVTATVAGISDSADLEIVEPPNIDLVEADLAAAAVVEGSSTWVSTTYENTGGPGSETVEVTADGATVASETIFVDSDAEKSLTLEWTPDLAAGESVEVAIDGESVGTLEVLESGTVELVDATFPAEIGPGSTYEYEVDLESTADVSAVETITYSVDDGPEVEESVAVAGGGSTVTLEHASADLQTGVTALHRVTLGDVEVNGTSEVVESAVFEIRTIGAPSSVEPGASLEVSVEITNTGGVSDTQEITLTADGETLATEAAMIEAGASEMVTLEVDGLEEGEYDLEVASEDDASSASLSVEAGGLPVPGFGVLAALVAAGALVAAKAVLVRRSA